MNKFAQRLLRVIDRITIAQMTGLLMLIMGLVLHERPGDGAAIVIRRIIFVGPQSYGLILVFFGALLFVGGGSSRSYLLSAPLLVYLVAESIYAINPVNREPLMNAVLFWAFYGLLIRLWTMRPVQFDIRTAAGHDQQ